MNARAALFDLYGDHLRSRGGRASVAALVRLLAPLGIAAPAVRTAVSRMVRQGWLALPGCPRGPVTRRRPVRTPSRRGGVENLPSWDDHLDRPVAHARGGTCA
ncbi:hypothetical protein ACFQX6_50660 [Streptosporangium lutulentum]